MTKQLKYYTFYLMILLDACAIAAAHVLAYLMRFEFSLSPKNIHEILEIIPFIVPLKILFIYYFGGYKGMWRYTGLGDILGLFKATVLAQVVMVVGLLYLNRQFGGFSRSVFFIDGVFCFIFIASIRVVIRMFFSTNNNNLAKLTKQVISPNNKNGTPVLVIGGGKAGSSIVKEMVDNLTIGLRPVGILDDDPRKHGRSIFSVPVLGGIESCRELAAKTMAKEIIIAIPSATGKEKRRIIESCKITDVPYKTLPGLDDLISGKVSVKSLRDVDYSDLLSRPPVHLDNEGIKDYLSGKTVLVTGGGGSIGSELCRQIVQFDPARLIILDSSEYNIHNIKFELNQEFGQDNVTVILGRIQDRVLVERLFRKYSPQVIFHAAAYKHVPLVELNPWEGIYNNIIGSKILMGVAKKYSVERFVLVSTDKAVRPTNVMGACKRVTELVLQSLCGDTTKFMAVRFGNVIGSSGSVVPSFRRQILKGGPVTITHPDITRYFMTIPEAAKLILQAGAMGTGGEIFILEMGTPVRIFDMAKDLIKLSGKEPFKDIDIIFTGLREGEKLHEELITHGEDVANTHHEKIMVIRANGFCNGINGRATLKFWLNRRLEILCEKARQYDGPAIKQELNKIISEYQPKEVDTTLEQRATSRLSDRVGAVSYPGQANLFNE